MQDGYGPQQTIESKPSHINEAVNRVCAISEQLEKLPEFLGERLEPVLFSQARPRSEEDKDGPKDGPKAMPPGSSLAHRIQGICDRMEESLSRVHGVINELDI